MAKYTGKSKNWHIACWNQSQGKTSAPRGTSKWESECEICKRVIRVGDLITWSTSPKDDLTPTSGAQQSATISTQPISSPNAGELHAPITPVPTYLAGDLIPLVDTLASKDPAKDAMDGIAVGVIPYLKARLAVPLSPSAPASAPLDPEEIERLVKQYATVVHIHTVELKNTETGEIRNTGIQHKLFPTLLKLASARKNDGQRLNIWLSGPAGSGKTTAAKNVATMLELPFGFCGALDAKYDLSGFINAAGICVHTEFRKLYTEGGVFLLDELDSWHPAAQLWLNAALANGYANFPDGTIDRNPDFVCIGAANTWGLGGTTEYVGRTKLDAAFLDRFSFKLDWQYDEDMELALSTNVAFTLRIQALRKKAKERGVKVIISPRKSIDGLAGLAAGFTEDEVLDMSVFAGLSAEDRNKLVN